MLCVLDMRALRTTVRAFLPFRSFARGKARGQGRCLVRCFVNCGLFSVRFPAHFCDFSSVSTPSLRPSSHVLHFFPSSTSFSSSRRSLWSALLSHVTHRGKARGQGRRCASKAQRVSDITATRHFNGDPGVCFIGTAPGSSLTLPLWMTEPLPCSLLH